MQTIMKHKIYNEDQMFNTSRDSSVLFYAFVYTIHALIDFQAFSQGVASDLVVDDLKTIFKYLYQFFNKIDVGMLLNFYDGLTQIDFVDVDLKAYKILLLDKLFECLVKKSNSIRINNDYKNDDYKKKNKKDNDPDYGHDHGNEDTNANSNSNSNSNSNANDLWIQSYLVGNILRNLDLDPDVKSDFVKKLASMNPEIVLLNQQLSTCQIILDKYKQPDCDYELIVVMKNFLEASLQTYHEILCQPNHQPSFLSFKPLDNYLNNQSFNITFEATFVSIVTRVPFKSRISFISWILRSLIQKPFSLKPLFLQVIHNPVLNQLLLISIKHDICDIHLMTMLIAMGKYRDLVSEIFDLEPSNQNQIYIHDLGSMITNICSEDFLNNYFDNNLSYLFKFKQLLLKNIQSETAYLTILLSNYLNHFSNNPSTNSVILKSFKNVLQSTNICQYSPFKTITMFLYTSYLQYDQWQAFEGETSCIYPNEQFQKITQGIYYFRRTSVSYHQIRRNLNDFINVLLLVYNMTTMKNIKYKFIYEQT